MMIEEKIRRFATYAQTSEEAKSRVQSVDIHFPQCGNIQIVNVYGNAGSSTKKYREFLAEVK